MKYEDYLAGVNKTWKRQDGLVDLLHCQIAIIEEVGEIAGWYKKHLGYGRPKNEEWKTGIKGEFGDLTYYLTKIAEITGNSHIIEHTFEFLSERGDQVEGVNYLAMIVDSMNQATKLSKLAYTSPKFAHHLDQLAWNLCELIIHEGWTVDEIQTSNLAKLAARHGDKGFKDSAAMEAGRDRVAEDEALASHG